MKGWQLSTFAACGHAGEESPKGTCGKPVLHVGGVQEAVTEPVPGLGVPIEQVRVVHDVAETAVGREALQVRGTLLSVFPSMSRTVAVTGCAVPLLARKLVCPVCWAPEGPSCRVMLCTGQVSKKSQITLGSGECWWKALLETPLAVAKIWVRPG